MAVSEQLRSAYRLLAGDTFDNRCPSRPIMDQVTTRWGTLIIAALITGPHRFSALHRTVGGISQKMLSQNLRALVRHGLVARDVEPTVPPQVTYRLTGLGEGLAEPLCAMMIWFGSNTDAMIEARERHDAVAEPS
ncbi:MULTISPECIES: winged helix-turn-helix transcriptional regulator [Catenuloplanes]|uniref:DNA-binding HxlR family transcriptional regulator n=1 Tax=Catenuloplanes niger TaxID=587534 RepID=A0AAE3ZMN6_9ACTN|nr:helix-turn-helix domain-containing protein [Catenuloplanes niger]MDR7322743.1 DNA-binding HxlR family transcriptional regulator [Catenuloplanes niger]